MRIKRPCVIKIYLSDAMVLETLNLGFIAAT